MQDRAKAPWVERPLAVLLLTTLGKSPPTIATYAEISTENHVLAPSQLFPSKTAIIRERYQSNGAATCPTPLWHHRHVLLPFDLRDPRVDIRVPEVSALLYELFPGTRAVEDR